MMGEEMEHMDQGYNKPRFGPRDYGGPMDRGLPRDYEGHMERGPPRDYEGHMDRGRGRGGGFVSSALCVTYSTVSPSQPTVWTGVHYGMTLIVL